MTAALATLVFLTTIWMLVVVGATLFERSRGKILVALRGRGIAAALTTRPVRARNPRFQPVRGVRLTELHRAAA